MTPQRPDWINEPQPISRGWGSLRARQVVLKPRGGRSSRFLQVLQVPPGPPGSSRSSRFLQGFQVPPGPPGSSRGSRLLQVFQVPPGVPGCSRCSGLQVRPWERLDSLPWRSPTSGSRGLPSARRTHGGLTEVSRPAVHAGRENICEVSLEMVESRRGTGGQNTARV